MPNEHRAEMEIDFMGQRRRMKGSFTFIAELESRTGRGAYAILMDVRNPLTIRVSDVAAVLYAGMRAADRKFNLEYSEVGEHVAEVGMLTFVPTCVEFLVKALTKDSDLREAEEEADPKTPTT